MYRDLKKSMIEYEIVPTSTPDESYILAVDDDHAILSVVMLLMETEDYASIGFSDSQKVIPFLEELHATGRRLPSVVLLDLMMPVISGYDIAAFMSKQTWAAHIPVIVMTADHRVTGVECVAGATDWMSKPFRIETLLSKLETYMAVPCPQ